MKFRCRIRLHKWLYTMPEATRVCEYCGEVQYGIRCQCWSCGDEFCKYMTLDKIEKNGIDLNTPEGKEYLWRD